MHFIWGNPVLRSAGFVAVLLAATLFCCDADGDDTGRRRGGWAEAAGDLLAKPGLPPSLAEQNLTMAELLQHVAPTLTWGFVPRTLAAHVYGEHDDGTPPGAPTAAVLELPEAENCKHIDKQLGKTHEELQRSGTRFFGDPSARDVYLQGLPRGLSVAKLATANDTILAVGPLPEDKAEEASEQSGRGKYKMRSYGVRHFAVVRAQLELPPPRLSAAAIEALVAMRALEGGGRDVQLPGAIRSFFRTFGTHVPAGPVLFGGLATASGGPVSWEAAKPGQRSAAWAHLDCLLAEMLQSRGASAGCKTPGQAYYGDAAAAAPPEVVAGGDPALASGAEWARSVRWDPVPSPTWGVIDAGAPVPIWEMITNKQHEKLLGSLPARQTSPVTSGEGVRWRAPSRPDGFIFSRFLCAIFCSALQERIRDEYLKLWCNPKPAPIPRAAKH
jgi:hypothetical protein